MQIVNSRIFEQSQNKELSRVFLFLEFIPRHSTSSMRGSFL